MLSFSPFTRKDKAIDAATSNVNAPFRKQTSLRKSPRSMKRWLSMRIINQDHKSPEKHGRFIPNTALGKTNNNTIRGSSVRSNIGTNVAAGEPIIPIESLSSYLLPVQTAGGCADISWTNNDEILFSLLQHGFEMPAGSPTLANPPPPSMESSDELDSKVVLLGNKRQSLRKASCDMGVHSNGAIGKKSPNTKSLPPRRKRSLIYAMYCTAQTDNTCAHDGSVDHHSCGPEAAEQIQNKTITAVTEEYLQGIPLHGSAPSLATTENMSTAFFSCQSMVSLTSKKETNCAKVADNALGIENIDDFREAVHIDKSALDIGDLNTLEDEEMFVGSARFEESCLASLAEIESTVSRTVSSNNSSRSSLAEEIPIVEPSAYRCSSRYAPRLSTIERAHDGRVRIVPSSVYTRHDFAEKIASACVPAARSSECLQGFDESSGSELSNSPAQIENGVETVLSLVTATFFPLSETPCANDSNSTETSTASSSVYTGSQASVSNIPASSNTKSYSTSLRPRNTQLVSAIATPPESPEKASTVTANASLSSSVLGSKAHVVTYPMSKIANDPSARKKHYSSDDCDLTSRRTETLGHYDKEIETLFGSARRSHSYDGSLLSTRGMCMNSLSPSAFCQALEESVMSEHPSSNTQISSSADRLSEQTSLLFDGDYDLEEVTDEMVRSIALIASPAYHGASEHIGPAGSAYIGEENYSDSVDIDGDIPLADILKASQATMVSQRALVKVAVTGASEADIPASADKENKHTQLHIPSEKTRWYTNAFVKATQLDSLRHLHLRMKASTTTQAARSSKRQSPVSKNGNVIRRKKGRNSNSSTIDGAKVPTNTSAPSVSTGPDPAIATGGTQVQQTVQPCTKKAFRFDEVVAVYETWDRHTYDRRGMPLTRLDAEQLETIKDELNSFKMHEMSVHEDSRTNTHIIF